MHYRKKCGPFLISCTISFHVALFAVVCKKLEHMRCETLQHIFVVWASGGCEQIYSPAVKFYNAAMM